jgi:hypothetical protein
VRELEINVDAEADSEKHRHAGENHHRICAGECNDICCAPPSGLNDGGGTRALLLLSVDSGEVDLRCTGARLRARPFRRCRLGPH